MGIEAVATGIEPLDVPLINANLAYAHYVVLGQCDSSDKVFKVRVFGGVRPTATVNLKQKIVRNPPVEADLDHIKVIIVQSPQIPYRTENRVSNGHDSTIAPCPKCKELEEKGANMIAIPRKTAHAFTERSGLNVILISESSIC